MSKDDFIKIAHEFRKHYCVSNENNILTEELKRTEKKLAVIFPKEYIWLLTEIGLLECPALAKLAIEKSYSELVIYEFVHPEILCKVNNEFRNVGLPDHYFCFALDGMGNAFCFANDEKDESIYTYDHDIKNIYKIATNLEQLIKDYIKKLR